jgi:RNA polymerase sigma-70 factor (ECF subfamily)
MTSDTERANRFNELAEAYSTDLYRYAMWICHNDALAKDLVQETFLRAWRALDSLKDIGAAKSWLITILRREYARTFAPGHYETGSKIPGPFVITGGIWT